VATLLRPDGGDTALSKRQNDKSELFSDKIVAKTASKSAAETEEEDYDQGDQMSLRKKSPKMQPSPLLSKLRNT
jgi:hypothetical protein